MSIEDEVRSEEDEVRREAHLVRDLRREVEHRAKEIDRLEQVVSLAAGMRQQAIVVPSWVRDGVGKAGKKAIATVQFSDPHFDEVVKPEQIGFYNAYNREIAEKRLHKLGDGILRVAFDYIAGVQYEGCTVLATGDIFSGDIHEELRRTNETTLLAGVRHWVGPTVAWLKMLAAELKRVHVAAVVGNHGREPGKPIYKNRAQSNIEWLFWYWVADVIAAQGDDRITFQIADGLSDVVQVYGTRYKIEHGDEFKGGSGISGAKAPLMLGQHRASVQQIAMGRPMDWMVVGHFHQYQPPAQGLIMGGSMKGYDEYAAGKHFRPERPQQGFWITSPEHGPTIAAPIFCDDREAEGW